MSFYDNKSCFTQIKESLSKVKTDFDLNDIRRRIMENVINLSKRDLQTLVNMYHKQGGTYSFKEELSRKDKKIGYLVENKCFFDKDKAIEFAKQNGFANVKESLINNPDGDDLEDYEDKIVWTNDNIEDIYKEDYEEDEGCITVEVMDIVPYLSREDLDYERLSELDMDEDEFLEYQIDNVKSYIDQTLGKRFLLDIPLEYCEDDSSIEDYIADYLSDETGYLIDSFEWYRVSDDDFEEDLKDVEIKKEEEEVKEEQQLNEGTSNFSGTYNIPLLIFDYYDDIVERMEYDSDYPQYEDYEDEDDFYEARDEFEEKYFDKIDYCILTDEDVENLKDDLSTLNDKIYNMSYNYYYDSQYEDNLTDEQRDEAYDESLYLESISKPGFVIESGYYEAYEIYNENGKDIEYLNDKDRDFILKSIDDIKKKYNLTELEVAYRMSNGETGYNIKKNESVVKEDLTIDDDQSKPVDNKSKEDKIIDDCITRWEDEDLNDEDVRNQIVLDIIEQIYPDLEAYSEDWDNAYRIYEEKVNCILNGKCDESLKEDKSDVFYAVVGYDKDDDVYDDLKLFETEEEAIIFCKENYDLIKYKDKETYDWLIIDKYINDKLVSSKVFANGKVIESLKEDTVKTKDGKWTNKGKEGTHGKFKTKKQADAQRKAMFANGYKEALKEDASNNEWENYGDVNFLTYGGTLLKEVAPQEYEIIRLFTPWSGTKEGEYILGTCHLNTQDYEDSMNKISDFTGADYSGLDKDKWFAVDLVDYYGTYQLGGTDEVLTKDEVIEVLKDKGVDIDTLGSFEESLKEGIDYNHQLKEGADGNTILSKIGEYKRQGLNKDEIVDKVSKELNVEKDSVSQFFNDIEEDFSKEQIDKMVDKTLQNDGGTFDKNTGEDADKDKLKDKFAVAYKDKGGDWNKTIDNVDRKVIDNTFNKAQKNAKEDEFVGTWNDKDLNKSSIDVVTTFDNEKDAIEFGKENEQDGVGKFDKNGDYEKTIYIKKEEEKKDESIDESKELDKAKEKDKSSISIKVNNISDIANLKTKEQRIKALERIVKKYIKEQKKNIKDFKIYSANYDTDEIVLKSVVTESLKEEYPNDDSTITNDYWIRGWHFIVYPERQSRKYWLYRPDTDKSKAQGGQITYYGEGKPLEDTVGWDDIGDGKIPNDVLKKIVGIIYKNERRIKLWYEESLNKGDNK